MHAHFPKMQTDNLFFPYIDLVCDFKSSDADIFLAKSTKKQFAHVPLQDALQQDSCW